MASKKILFTGLIFSFFCIAIYIHNLSASVYAGDVGDLVTAAYLGGVAHPPGYPLMTLLGFLSIKLFTFFSIAFRVGLISAFASGVGILFFYLTAYRLTKNTILSLLSAAVLAFSYSYWFYAEIAEVFALNNFFIIILIYFAISFYQTGRKSYFLLLLLFAGLSLTNHHTIVLFFPSLFILSAANFWKLFQKDKKILLWTLLAFFGGLSIYLYVPIASSHNPPINWDNVHDLVSFKKLILREDYGTFAAGSFTPPIFEQRIIILQTYFWYLLHQLTIPVIALSLIGAIYLCIKQRLVAISLLLAFLLSGPVFIGYAGFPLLNSFYIGIYERFFIMSAILVVYFFPFGIVAFCLFLGNFLQKKSLFFIQSIFFLIPLLLFFYNFPKTNLSEIYIGDTFAKDYLTPLPPNAVLFLSGDTQLFNNWYAHYALGFRPDVRIINMNGLPSSDFFMQQRKSYLKNHPKEKNENTIVIGTIIQISQKFPVYSQNEISMNKSKQWGWIPYGLSKRLHDKNNKIDKKTYTKDSNDIWESYHIPKRGPGDVALGNLSIASIPSFYSDALLSTGNYFFTQLDDKKQAYTFYKRAVMVDLENARARAVLATYFLTVEKSCQKAKTQIDIAIELDRFQKIPYFVRYSIYKECFKNTKKANEVVKQYKNFFKEDFYKNVKDALKM